jgi:hypothetical protein
VKSGSGSIGPYRHTSEHQFVREDYAQSSEDDALLAKNPWLHDPRAAEQRQLGPLVQLRRSKDKPLTQPDVAPSNRG